MLRKPLVNDLVHSFCYASRHDITGEKWPWSIRGNPMISRAKQAIKFTPKLLTPFAVYMYAHCQNYVQGQRNLILFAALIQECTVEEYEYAIYLLDKYYGIRASKTGDTDDKHIVPGNIEQVIRPAPELAQYDQLLDAE